MFLAGLPSCEIIMPGCLALSTTFTGCGAGAVGVWVVVVVAVVVVLVVVVAPVALVFGGSAVSSGRGVGGCGERGDSKFANGVVFIVCLLFHGSIFLYI